LGGHPRGVWLACTVPEGRRAGASFLLAWRYRGSQKNRMLAGICVSSVFLGRAVEINVLVFGWSRELSSHHHGGRGCFSGKVIPASSLLLPARRGGGEGGESRTTGLVLQCRLHQQSAPQTNSKAISWLSGPSAFSDSRILPLGLGPETFKIRPRRAGFQPPGPGETFVLPSMGRRLQPRVGGPGGGPVWAPSGCPGESSKLSILISPPPMDR
jgi:hypothetical protein